jgi:hypothetical protein
MRLSARTSNVEIANTEVEGKWDPSRKELRRREEQDNATVLFRTKGQDNGGGEGHGRASS